MFISDINMSVCLDACACACEGYDIMSAYIFVHTVCVVIPHSKCLLLNAEAQR